MKYTFCLILLLAVSIADAASTRIGPKRRKNPSTYVYWTHEMKADFNADNYEKYNELDGADPAVVVDEVEAGTDFPLYMSDSIRLMAGVSLGWHHFQFSDADLNNLDTYNIGIPFHAMIPLNEQWMIMGIFSPSIASDLERINSDDLTHSSILLGTYRWSDTLSFSLGAAYSSILGEEKYFPAGALEWQPAADWSISIGYPKPNISYTINDSSRIALGIEPAGGQWNIKDPRTTGNTGDEYNFEFGGWHAGLAYEYDLNDHITLLADIGFTFSRDYTIENDDETILDNDVDDTLGARIGLLFRC